MTWDNRTMMNGWWTEYWAVEFEVRWNLSDMTWEPYEHCQELAALDDYLDEAGVNRWQSLPKKTGPK